MIFRNDRRRILPVFLVSCLMPLMAAFSNGRLERIRTVDFLLIFTSGFGLGACVLALGAIKRAQKATDKAGGRAL